jgi:hypothetical protein
MEAGGGAAGLLAGAGRGVGRRGERQQGAEEHREGGPEHEKTRKQRCGNVAASGQPGVVMRSEMQSLWERMGVERQRTRAKDEGAGRSNAPHVEQTFTQP